MSGQSKSPASPLLPEHPIHVLLLRANDLPIPAKLELIPHPIEGRWDSCTGEAAMRIDSLGDLNFMEEPLMVVWTIRRISSWIIGG